jgi:GNAT superfamily N-acetyltransferase
MSTNELSYGLATREDSDSLLALYQELYPDHGWTHEYLSWQYFANPSGDSRIGVARDRDLIVATYTALPYELLVRGEAYVGWRIQDVMTRPEYRGRGLSNQLAREAAEFLSSPQYPLNFAYPNDGSYGGLIRNDWVAAYRIPLWFLPSGDTARSSSEPGVVEPLGEFDREAESVWEAHYSRLDYAVNRSAQHLNWRFFANPKNDYDAFKIDVLGETAFLVLKLYEREDGSRLSHLCDVFSTADEVEVYGSVVDFWAGFNAEHRCDAMSCWTTAGIALEKVLVTRGFERQLDPPRWLALQAQGPEDDRKRVQDPHRWHLSMGDSDVY